MHDFLLWTGVVFFLLLTVVLSLWTGLLLLFSGGSGSFMPSTGALWVITLILAIGSGAALFGCINGLSAHQVTVSIQVSHAKT